MHNIAAVAACTPCCLQTCVLRRGACGSAAHAPLLTASPACTHSPPRPQLFIANLPSNVGEEALREFVSTAGFDVSGNSTAFFCSTPAQRSLPLQ